MSKYVWGVALLVAVGGLIAVGISSGKFGGDDSQDSAPASASTDKDSSSSSSSDAGSIAATQTVSIKVPGMW